MDYVEMSIRQRSVAVYNELKNIPFYKTSNGYAYAAYLLEDTDVATETRAFLNTEGYGREEYGGELGYLQMRGYVEEAIKKLSDIVISDEALAAWVTFQKETDGVKVYHDVLEKLRWSILLYEFDSSVIGETNGGEQILTNEGQPDVIQCEYETGHVDCTNLRRRIQKDHEKQIIGSVILNHNNPFSDISIEEQRFIYGSVMGQYEALGLQTSHTLTKVIKDTERSYIALQPGFKIKKSKVTENEKHQDIIFDDTMTTEITQNTDNIYVYID